MAKRKTPEPLYGYGIIVGGSQPYVADVFVSSLSALDPKSGAEMRVTEKYHHVVPVVLITRAEYRRLTTPKRKAACPTTDDAPLAADLGDKVGESVRGND